MTAHFSNGGFTEHWGLERKMRCGELCAVVLPTELLSVNEPGKLPMRGKAALRRQLVN
jgi:hypothetical protein